MYNKTTDKPWQEILEFWFPEGVVLNIDPVVHKEYWAWRLHGGADDEINSRFLDLTIKAADGELHDWAIDPAGRLALIIVLDQFSRSVWRGVARAYAQDNAALELTMAGLANGHYESLITPWCKIVYGQPLGHCESANHLEQIDLLIQLREQILAQAPDRLLPIYQSLVKQAHDVRAVIATFGRYPHRNQVLGRQSTPSEKTYITAKKYPHLGALKGDVA